MKSIISLAALIGLAAAGPVQKRDLATEVVVHTEWTTTTIYVSPPSGAAFAENPKKLSSASISSAASIPAAVASPAPVENKPAAAYVAPPVENKPIVVPDDKPAPYVAPPVKEAPPAAGTLKSGAGEGTNYDVTVGLGSCGLPQADHGDPVVALSLADMNNGVNPNKNPLCGKAIYVTYKGATHRLKVYDSCAGCKAGDVDFSEGWFGKVMPGVDGRGGGLTWEIKDEAF